jgi:hypothetical protein
LLNTVRVPVSVYDFWCLMKLVEAVETTLLENSHFEFVQKIEKRSGYQCVLCANLRVLDSEPSVIVWGYQRASKWWLQGCQEYGNERPAFILHLTVYELVFCAAPKFNKRC